MKKKEILDCFTWYANKVAETVQYKHWSDEFCRKENETNTRIFLKELQKYIDWNNLTIDICEELRFIRWTSDEDINKEIKNEVSEDEKRKLEKQRGLMLIPLYLLPIVPNGTELTSIAGEVIKYYGNNIDNDNRYGCIAYGIKVKEDSK